MQSRCKRQKEKKNTDYIVTFSAQYFLLLSFPVQFLLYMLSLWFEKSYLTICMDIFLKIVCWTTTAWWQPGVLLSPAVTFPNFCSNPKIPISCSALSIQQGSLSSWGSLRACWVFESHCVSVISAESVCLMAVPTCHAGLSLSAPGDSVGWPPSMEMTNWLTITSAMHLHPHQHLHC